MRSASNYWTRLMRWGSPWVLQSGAGSIINGLEARLRDMTTRWRMARSPLHGRRGTFELRGSTNHAYTGSRVAHLEGERWKTLFRSTPRARMVLLGLGEGGFKPSGSVLRAPLCVCAPRTPRHEVHAVHAPSACSACTLCARGVHSLHALLYHWVSFALCTKPGDVSALARDGPPLSRPSV